MQYQNRKFLELNYNIFIAIKFISIVDCCKYNNLILTLIVIKDILIDNFDFERLSILFYCLLSLYTCLNFALKLLNIFIEIIWYIFRVFLFVLRFKFVILLIVLTLEDS